MRIAYLCSQDTLPESIHRRADAFEHDQMIESLQPPLADCGFQLEAVDWRAEVDWSDYGAALIGTAWDYCDDYPLFLKRLENIEKSTRLFNPVSLIRWNGCKTYLRDLADRGAPVIPTLWFNALTSENLEQSFQTFGPDLVCKNQTGAGAIGQHRVRLGDALPDMREPVMVQQYLPTIEKDGELSFVFVAGEFSHAVCKRPQPGDYRIQSLYGGTEHPFEPATKDMDAASTILRALAEMPLYARVDMVRDEKGGLMLMELELIEPYLYPRPDCTLGEKLGGALHRALGTCV